MKARFPTHAVVATTRHSQSDVCVLRPGLGAKSLLSFCSAICVAGYQRMQAGIGTLMGKVTGVPQGGSVIVYKLSK